MMSSNAGARLLSSESQEYEMHPNFLSSDSDTVLVTDIDLLGPDQPEFRYWIVVWSENGIEKAPRRFWNYRDALIFSERLKCRLDLDAYARDLAAHAAKKDGHP